MVAQRHPQTGFLIDTWYQVHNAALISGGHVKLFTIGGKCRFISSVVWPYVYEVYMYTSKYIHTPEHIVFRIGGKRRCGCSKRVHARNPLEPAVPFGGQITKKLSEGAPKTKVRIYSV